MAAAQEQPARSPLPMPDSPATLRDAGLPRDRGNQRIERIRVEDGGSRVEEVRYGGQTQSISVQPRADVPAYEILPEGGPRARAASRDGVPGPAGQRVWNVLNF
jgi:hypothetical protein